MQMKTCQMIPQGSPPLRLPRQRETDWIQMILEDWAKVDSATETSQQLSEKEILQFATTDPGTSDPGQAVKAITTHLAS